ncbi:MAG TPA: flagellar basal body P-ring formation chaperone FlgA, partial [Syntrophales bacterium]|nr:flagellar basal body P-ring formation chaperone FlgA [Syntrophales bacterium]
MLFLILMPLEVGATLKGEVIREEIIRHIERSMPWDKEEVRIDVDLPADQTDLPERQVNIKVNTLGKDDYIGEMTFSVRLSHGRVYRQMNVRGRIEILRSIVVAARDIKAESVIQEEDLTVKKKWVTHLDSVLIYTPEEAVGRQVRTSIRAGSEIKKTVLHAPILVKKGKTVRISLEKGPLRISTIGVSEEDGARGALIRVRNVSSNRLVYAR